MMLNLSVLMWVRPDFYSFPGGDTLQVKYTARALQELGCEVDISCDPDLGIEKYDIVHLWHLERCHDTWLFYRQAQKSNKRIFLSPIYWPASHRPLTDFWRIQSRAQKENVKCLVRLCMSSSKSNRHFLLAFLKKGWSSCRKKLLNEVDQLLPNSESEAAILQQELSHNVPVKVISNVIDPDMCDTVEKLPWEIRKGVLCVGHFCPRKNQLALIKALKNSPISVVFVGGPRPMHPGYYESCRRTAGEKHTFLGNCSNERVLELMGQSKVHVQVSRFETPGIVNLEAGLMGCNLVLPPVSPVRDYFGDLASYFNDYSSDSILKAIFSAVNNNPLDSISDYIRNNFTLKQLKSQLSIAYQ